MLDIFCDALLDTVKLLPFLVVLYIIIELIESKTNLASKKSLGGKYGVLIGSATGLIPQCGFSVMAAKLYEQKYITVGTLLAIFFSTSDEAFILLLPQAPKYLLFLLLSKMLIGVTVGYSADFILRLFKRKENTSKDLFFQKEDSFHAECTSCGREHDEEKPFKTYFLSPFLHSLYVAFFIFVVNFVLGGIIYLITEERFKEILETGIWLQPLLTSAVGLIPNCASSVILTECLVENTITFGSCVAGLCANAGLGFVVLLKDTKRWKRNLCLILITYVLSVGFGLLINLVFPTV